MTAKELIQQYVTAHADNRWMDASELETLLTEFAEKLKEPTSEDLEQAARKYKMQTPFQYPNQLQPAYEAFIAGAQWQRERMMKDAVEGYIEGDQRNQEDEPYDVYAVSDSLDTTKFKIGDKVKVIIIKE